MISWATLQASLKDIKATIIIEGKRTQSLAKIDIHLLHLNNVNKVLGTFLKIKKE